MRISVKLQRYRSGFKSVVPDSLNGDQAILVFVLVKIHTVIGVCCWKWAGCIYVSGSITTPVPYQEGDDEHSIARRGMNLRVFSLSHQDRFWRQSNHAIQSVPSILRTCKRKRQALDSKTCDTSAIADTYITYPDICGSYNLRYSIWTWAALRNLRFITPIQWMAIVRLYCKCRHSLSVNGEQWCKISHDNVAQKSVFIIIT